MTLATHLITFLVAFIPVLVWLLIFGRKHKNNPWTTFFTFIGGILAAQLILLYKGSWDSSLNFIFFKVDLIDFRANISSLFVDAAVGGFAVFLGIAVMEEVAKFLVMKTLNKDQFHSIDDVIGLAIVSALGFSFYENLIYFNAQWGNLEAGHFAFLVISRITIVTMVHMLCSGVLGYYFGLAHFASPILLLEHQQKKRHPLLMFFKNIFHLSKIHVYRDEMMALGLISAIGLHALYNFILSPDTHLASWLVSALIVFYFFGGYLFLAYLLKKKEDKIELGLITNHSADDQ